MFNRRALSIAAPVYAASEGLVWAQFQLWLVKIPRNYNASGRYYINGFVLIACTLQNRCNKMHWKIQKRYIYFSTFNRRYLFNKFNRFILRMQIPQISLKQHRNRLQPYSCCDCLSKFDICGICIQNEPIKFIKYLRLSVEINITLNFQCIFNCLILSRSAWVQFLIHAKVDRRALW